MHVPRFQRKDLVFGLVAVFVVGAVIVFGVVSAHVEAHRNKGADTTCPEFLKMTDSKRRAVLEKMDFAPAYVASGKVLSDAVMQCGRPSAVGDPELALGDAFGP